MGHELRRRRQRDETPNRHTRAGSSRHFGIGGCALARVAIGWRSDPGADGRSDVLSHPTASRKRGAWQRLGRRGKSGHRRAGRRARPRGQARAARVKARRRTVPQRRYRLRGNSWVRVKRWGKSPPRWPRGRRQGKPRPVHGKLGYGAAGPLVAGRPHSCGCGRRETGARGTEEPARRETGVERNDRRSGVARRRGT